MAYLENINSVKYGHKKSFNQETLYKIIENGYKLQYELFIEAQHGEDNKLKIDEITCIFNKYASIIIEYGRFLC